MQTVLSIFQARKIDFFTYDHVVCDLLLSSSFKGHLQKNAIHTATATQHPIHQAKIQPAWAGGLFSADGISSQNGLVFISAELQSHKMFLRIKIKANHPNISNFCLLLKWLIHLWQYKQSRSGNTPCR